MYQGQDTRRIASMERLQLAYKLGVRWTDYSLDQLREMDGDCECKPDGDACSYCKRHNQNSEIPY